MKKIFSAFLTLLMLLAPAITAVSAASGLTIVCGSVTGAPGETVTVAINLTENPGFAYLRVGIAYDDDAMTLDSVENGDFDATLTNGKTYIWSNSDDITGTGTLALLTFTINTDAAIGEYAFTVESKECYTIMEEDVAVAVTNGTVTAACKHANTAESSGVPAGCEEDGRNAEVSCKDCGTHISGGEVLPATGHRYADGVCTVCGGKDPNAVPVALLGDLNGDGKINARDYMVLKSYVLKRVELADEQLLTADINRDGRVTAADYMILKAVVLRRATI